MTLSEKIINNVELAEKYLNNEYDTAPKEIIPFNRITSTDINRTEFYKANNDIIGVFDNIKFNPTDSYIFIYEDVIDKLIIKYWNANNRKKTIEDKVEEFYNEFKEFKNVTIAYKHFIDSDRLFED